MAANNGALKFKFNPMQDGITTVLGPLEAQIMAVAWEMQHATASDVHHTLQLNRQRENRDIAYTTVMTTMSRLYDKNILHRRKVGMSFVYTPALGQAECVARVVKNVLVSLVGEFEAPVVRYFVDYIARDERVRQQVSRALAEPAPTEAAPH